MIGGNLLPSQTPLSSLLAGFPMLFVCGDMAHWRLETGQGREGFGICTTRCPPQLFPLPKLCPQALFLAPWDQVSCLQVPERHISVCSPTQTALCLSFLQVGVASDRVFLKESFFLPSLFPSTPSNCKNILASFHHLGLMLDLSLLL